MDARIVKTKAAVKSAMLELLKDYTLSAISVSMLCKKANINRNTFYAHYRYPEEVFDEIVDQVLQDMYALCYANRDSIMAGDSLCTYVKEHQDVCRVILSANGEGRYLRLSLIHAQELEENKILSTMFSPEEQTFVNIYIVAGSMAVLRHWVTTGMKYDLSTIGACIDKMFAYEVRKRDGAEPVETPLA